MSEGINTRELNFIVAISLVDVQLGDVGWVRGKQNDTYFSFSFAEEPGLPSWSRAACAMQFNLVMEIQHDC